jgi:hypothetical protein
MRAGRNLSLSFLISSTRCPPEKSQDKEKFSLRIQNLFISLIDSVFAG